MGRFFLDVVYAAAFISVGTLVLFVLLPSGKLDLPHVFFSLLIGIVWGIPLGVVYAFGRLILKGTFQ